MVSAKTEANLKVVKWCESYISLQIYFNRPLKYFNSYQRTKSRVIRLISGKIRKLIRRSISSSPNHTISPSQKRTTVSDFPARFLLFFYFFFLYLLFLSSLLFSLISLLYPTPCTPSAASSDIPHNTPRKLPRPTARSTRSPLLPLKRSCRH